MHFRFQRGFLASVLLVGAVACGTRSGLGSASSDVGATASTASGTGIVGAGTSGGGASSNTSSTASTSTGAGAGAGGGGAPTCASTVIPMGPDSACDNTGDCGGVSVGGCTLCAVDTVCADVYAAWIASLSTDEGQGWRACGLACTGDDAICCQLDCEAQYPDAVAAEHALAQCLSCGACQNDCADAIGITSFDSFVCGP